MIEEKFLEQEEECNEAAESNEEVESSDKKEYWHVKTGTNQWEIKYAKPDETFLSMDEIGIPATKMSHHYIVAEEGKVEAFSEMAETYSPFDDSISVTPQQHLVAEATSKVLSNTQLLTNCPDIKSSYGHGVDNQRRLVEKYTVRMTFLKCVVDIFNLREMTEAKTPNGKAMILKKRKLATQ